MERLERSEQRIQTFEKRFIEKPKNVEQEFQTFRFRFLKNRDGASLTQLQKIYFQDKKTGALIDMTMAHASCDSTLSQEKENPSRLLHFGPIGRETGSKWCAVGEKHTLYIRFPRKFNIDKYIFQLGNDCPERDPSRWILEASNDEEEWTLLHEQLTDWIGTGGNCRHGIYYFDVNA